jgi:hypothetical protein
MRLRLLLIVAITLAAIQSAAAQYATQSALAAAVPPRKVITWVPPYGIAAAKAQLVKTYSGYGPRNGITHLALQFFKPTKSGGVGRATHYGTASSSDIKWFVTWGHKYGIKVVLCIYNGENGWDWPLAKAAFTTGKTAFVNNLIDKMNAFGFDGIDVDLEGIGDLNGDKDAYVSFIQALAERVHVAGKTLTIDSFHYIYNAPNQDWWAALFPLVDGINSMGYEDLGRNAPTWQKYLAQKQKAGAYSAKLQIGLPTHLPEWQGNTTLQQVQWFKTTQAGRVGIAIWDAQFQHPSWATKSVWSYLRLVRLQP